MSDVASEKCVRSFGLVQATWATRNAFQDEVGRAEHEVLFDQQVASFQSEFSAVVKYTSTGTLQFEFCKPAQLPLDDRVYDPSEEIMAVIPMAPMRPSKADGGKGAGPAPMRGLKRGSCREGPPPRARRPQCQ
jgi:hypothetical protein